MTIALATKVIAELNKLERPRQYKVAQTLGLTQAVVAFIERHAEKGLTAREISARLNGRR